MDEDEGVPPHRGRFRSTFAHEAPQKTLERLRDERGDLQCELEDAEELTLSTGDALSRAQVQLESHKQELEDLRHKHDDLWQHAEGLEHRVGELTDQKAVLENLLETADDATEQSGEEGGDEGGGAGLAVTTSVAPGVATPAGETVADELAALKDRLAALQAENEELTAEVRDLKDAKDGEQEARLVAEQTAKSKAQEAVKAEEKAARLAAEKMKLAETLAEENAQLPIRLQRMQAELERTRVAANLARAEAERAQSMAAVAEEDGPSLFDDLEGDPPPAQDVGKDSEEAVRTSVELKDANSRVVELEVSMRELQSKWDAQQLESQKEEAAAEEAKQKKIQEEEVVVELRARRPRRTMVVYENERRPVLESSEHPEASGLPAKGYHCSTLLDVERPNFSDSTGAKMLPDPKVYPDQLLPAGSGWEWDGEWDLDESAADADGWQYSFNFVRTPMQRVCGEDIQWTDSPVNGIMDSSFVRRRRWARQSVNISLDRDSMDSAGAADGMTPADRASVVLARTMTTPRDGLADLLEGRGDIRLVKPSNVSVQYLQTAGGGSALEGELYKEGKSWPHNWERRYFVLWPKRACAAGSVADTARRYQLLFYFKAIDSDAAQGVAVVPVSGDGTTTVHSYKAMKMEHYTAEEKEERKGFDCRKLMCSEITGVTGIKDLETQPRMFKLGVPTAAGGTTTLRDTGMDISSTRAAESGPTIVQWEEALTGSVAEDLMVVEWMYADAGFPGTRGLAAVNPLRWSSGSVVDIVAQLQDPTTKVRPIAVRMQGQASDPKEFVDPAAAVTWLNSGPKPTTEDELKGREEEKCQGCADEFGILKWRHHCRQCQGAFCDGCSPHKVELKGAPTAAPQRVCKACFAQQAEPGPEPQPEGFHSGI